jgi:hypothetical protein
MKSYKPFNPHSIGTTISCYTLARLLDEHQNNNLNRKVHAHICRYFRYAKNICEAIVSDDARRKVGHLLIEDVRSKDIPLKCPEKIKMVIRNVKYAYIKDLFIAEFPKNYKFTEEHVPYLDYDE